jgi:hypothetical protein
MELLRVLSPQASMGSLGKRLGIRIAGTFPDSICDGLVFKIGFKVFAGSRVPWLG